MPTVMSALTTRIPFMTASRMSAAVGSQRGADDLVVVARVDVPVGVRGMRPVHVNWSHPAYANRHIYARNDDEIICASLAADGSRHSGGGHEGDPRGERAHDGGHVAPCGGR